MQEPADHQQNLPEESQPELVYMPGIGLVIDYPVQSKPKPVVKSVPKVKVVDRRPMQIGAGLGLLAILPLHYMMGWEWVHAFLMAVLWLMPLGAIIGSAFSRE